MNNRIYTKLKNIQEKENVKIIFAVEIGSRAYGYASPNSDYDVRFIYVRTVKDYLKLTNIKDTIEEKEEGLDIVGWDLKKALKLLFDSNASILQWFMSPSIYHETDISTKLRELLPKYFSEKKLLHNYAAIAYNAFPAPCELEEKVKIKDYLRRIHSILIAQYIDKYKNIPPVTFKELLSANTILMASTKEQIEKIVMMRKRGNETMLASDLLNQEYVQNMMFDLDEAAYNCKHEKKDWHDLNEFFVEVVLNG